MGAIGCLDRESFSTSLNLQISLKMTTDDCTLMLLDEFHTSDQCENQSGADSPFLCTQRRRSSMVTGIVDVKFLMNVLLRFSHKLMQPAGRLLI
jgi:hypothetical protein